MTKTLRTSALALALALSVSALAPQAKAADVAANHVMLNGKTYDLAPGDYVIGTDHELYSTISWVDGKIQLQKVAVTEWGDHPATSLKDEPAAPITKDVDFIAEVEIKDCADFCGGNRVFHSGGAESAKVDRVFSGGTLTAYRSITNSLGLTVDHALVMTKSVDVVKEDSFLHHGRGTASARQ